jgi:AcrR family transcriptional regulator
MADLDRLRQEIRDHSSKRREAMDAAEREFQAALRVGRRALKAGMTIKELAELTGVTRPTLYDRLGLKNR